MHTPSHTCCKNISKSKILSRENIFLLDRCNIFVLIYILYAPYNRSRRLLKTISFRFQYRTHYISIGTTQSVLYWALILALPYAEYNHTCYDFVWTNLFCSIEWEILKKIVTANAFRQDIECEIYISKKFSLRIFLCHVALVCHFVTPYSCYTPLQLNIFSLKVIEGYGQTEGAGSATMTNMLDKSSGTFNTFVVQYIIGNYEFHRKPWWQSQVLACVRRIVRS